MLFFKYIKHIHMNNLNINIKLIIFKLLFFILILYFNYFLTGEIRCDDGIIPIEEFDYSTTTPSWENNYQNRTITLQESYPEHINNGSIYQAYNERLQATSQGYRYELGGGSGTININATNYSMEGKPVALEYVGTDINGCHMYKYAYPTTSYSTQLGEIEPIPSEVINNRFYEGGGLPKPPLDYSKTTVGKKIYNKAKVLVKNRLAKYNEPSWQRSERLRTIDNANARAREEIRRAQVQIDYERRLALYNGYQQRELAHQMHKKVRRFD